MELLIKGSAKEIAELVSSLQAQSQIMNFHTADDKEAIRKTMDSLIARGLS